MFTKLFILFLCFAPLIYVFGQPKITPRLDKKELKLFFGDGTSIDIKRITYRGAPRGVGLFTDKDSIFNMESGLVLSSGSVKRIGRINQKQNTSSRNWSRGSKRLNKISINRTKDAARIEITFVPLKNYISFNYVFGSEEYPEYIKSSFNDAFAFYLEGPKGEVTNLAVIPNTEDKIAINSVNYLRNQEYYVNNSKLVYNLVDDVKIDTSYFWKENKKYAVYITYNITAAIANDPKIPVEFDGFTKLLQAKAEVIPGERYKLILIVADAGDRIYDSGVLIEAGSFNASDNKDFKYGALAIDTNYYYTIDTVLVDSIVEKQTSTKSPCLDTIINLFYETNHYHLTDTERETIIGVISRLDSTCQYIVQIDAYTDEVGTDTFNKVLSMNRSQKVLNFIKSQDNSQIIEISAAGHGIDRNAKHSRKFKRRTSIHFVCQELK